MTEFQKDILANAKHFDVISFDIFDTLLLRPLMCPSDVFEIIEHETGQKGFAAVRKRAAIDSFEQADCHDKEERTLGEIYGLIPQYAGLAECEKDVESRLLVGNPELIRVFNELKESGKRIILSSDMYLPGDFIKTVLHKNGIDGWRGFYLSNECGVRKSTGNLWEHIVKSENVAPDRILHIGDDFNSDFETPRRYGVVTYKYEKVVDRFIRENPWAKTFLESGRSPIRRNMIGAVAVIRQIISCGEECVDWRPNLAVVLLLVIGYSYSMFVVKDAKRRGLNKLLMLARDGYNLEPIINILAPEIATKYVYAPRQDFLVIAQNFIDNSYEPKWSILRFWRCRQRRPQNEHRSLFLSLLKQYREENNSVDWDSADENAFLNWGRRGYVLETAMGAFTKSVTNEYRQYFNTLGISCNDKVGLVDLTSVRGSAHRLLSMFSPVPIHAYYYFRNTGRDSDWHFADSSSFISGTTSLCIDQGLVEYFYSAPSPSIIGVRNLKPVYDKRDSFYDKYKFESVSLVRDSIIRGSELLKRWGTLDEMDASVVTDWKEVVLKWASERYESAFSFVLESYGVSNRHWYRPLYTLRRGRRSFRLFGKVLLSMELKIKAMRRHYIFRLFGRLPILKLTFR